MGRGHRNLRPRGRCPAHRRLARASVARIERSVATTPATASRRLRTGRRPPTPTTRLTGLIDLAGDTFVFGYDRDGRITSVDRSNGVDTTQSYDAAGRLARIDHVGPGGPIEFYDYALDADSNRTAMSSVAGAETYTINAINQLTDVVYPNGDTQSYTYDPAGNRLTDTFNGTTTNYSYDNASQLTALGSDVYSYDAAGNRTAAGTDTYTWDWAARLESATVAGQTSTYTYDGDGVRVSDTTGVSTTDYVWDRVGGLETLISDGTTGYVHANGQVLTQTGATTDYLLPDALGSIRMVADPAGAVSGTGSYDVFGTARSASGTSSVFGFTGQQSDPTELVYLRARYLDPGIGGFLGADPVTPGGPGVAGYNPYTYVASAEELAVVTASSHPGSGRR